MMRIIKKVLAVMLLAAMPMGLLAACGNGNAGGNQSGSADKGESTRVYYNTKWDKKTLKVLAIGNSYSVDTLTYLYDIAAADGVGEIVLGNLYIGGCTLERHSNNAQTGTADYIYYKNTDGKWVETPNATLLQGILDEDWDVITIQQQSMNAGIPSSYEGHLEELIGYVQRNKTNPGCQLAWHMTWAYTTGSTNENFSPFHYDQDTMYESITSAVQLKILPCEQIAIVIPSGTVIQSGRSCFGDRFNRDAYDHLNDFGKLLTGYMWYSSLTGEPILELKFVPEGMELTQQIKLDMMNCLTAAYIDPFTPKK